MSTTTEDVAATDTETLRCSLCGTTVPKPPPVQWSPLWAEGWRWIGSQNLYSCPACPPVIVVDEARHVGGPGIELALRAAEE
ncbi:hypothetical protein ACFW5V_32590 [Streptomyces sp. NPDC058762]|uniref:hypothetical protein n=1 Tax=Streptomyces sp. NPDC058762 TaxID=3346629 RepID=UPI0036C81F53